MPNKTPLISGVSAAIIATAIVYFGSYWNPKLASTIFITYSIGIGLLIQYRHILRPSSNLFTAIFALTITLAPFLGVTSDLPISSDLRTSLIILIYGISACFSGIILRFSSEK